MLVERESADHQPCLPQLARRTGHICLKDPLSPDAFREFQYPTPPLARGRGGIHELLDIETARATADTLTTLHDELAAGTGISGPAARRAIHAAARAPTFAGSIRTHRQAQDILSNPALTVYDNPHSFLMCVYNRDRALCHRLDVTDAPGLDRCQPTCANIARTDCHADELVQHAQALEKQAASEAVPGPLADRLTRRADHLRDLADRHHHDRIDLQEPTS